MRDTAIELVPFAGWVGGLNREVDQFQVAENETPDALNVDFGLGGSVKRRQGRTVDSAGVASKTGGMIVPWRDDYVIVADGGDVLTIESGTTADSATDLGTGPFSGQAINVAHASMNDKLYLTRLDSVTPVTWNGTTIGTITATDFAGTAARFPRARALAHLHERIFAGNVRTATGPTDYPSRLYWSDALDPETWQALSYIEVSPDDDQGITALRPLNDSLLIFKDHKMFVLSGVDADTFTLYPLDDQVGTTAPHTVAVDGGRAIFYDERRGVMMFDGAEFTRLSDKIVSHLLDNVNVTALETAQGVLFQNRYYLSVPWKADTAPSRTFVYDLRTGAWTEYDYGFTGAAEWDNVLYGRLSGDIDTFRLNDGATDDGVAIAAQFRSGWIAPAGFGTMHRLRRMETSWDIGSAASSVTFNLRRNLLVDPYITQVITLDPLAKNWNTLEWGTDKWGSTVEEILSRTTGWGQRWRLASVEFTTEDDVELSGMVWHVSVRDRKRGEY